MAQSQQFVFVILVALFATIQIAQCQECTIVGPQCSADCKDIVLCPALGAAPIVTVKCFELHEKFCSKVDDMENAFECNKTFCDNPNVPHPFLCTGAGFYPSAYNCSLAYFCSAAGADPIQECACAEGEIYDTATGSCKVAAICERDPANCAEIGKETPLADNFCYVCNDKRDAIVYKCPAGDGGSGNGSGDDEPEPETRDLSCRTYEPPPRQY